MINIQASNTTLEYFDGFDDYVTSQAARYWTTPNNMAISSTGGRNGTAGLVVGPGPSGAGPVVTLGAQATRTVGFALKLTGFPFQNLVVAFLDAGTTQVDVRANTDGTLVVTRNGTALATSTQSLVSNTWYYLEFSATIHNTAGAYTLKVNGTTFLTASGVNTRATANNSANQLWVGNIGGSVQLFVDDLYSRADGTFCGDVRVETGLPNANGATNQWSQGGTTHPSNYQQVSDDPSDDDTTYVVTGTVGQVELYAYPALPTTAGTVLGVMAVAVCRNDSAGQVSLQPAYRSGGANHGGNTQTVGSTTYAAYMDIQGQDPATSAAWTVSGVNALQVGATRTA